MVAFSTMPGLFERGFCWGKCERSDIILRVSVVSIFRCICCILFGRYHRTVETLGKNEGYDMMLSFVNVEVSEDNDDEAQPEIEISVRGNRFRRDPTCGGRLKKVEQMAAESGII